MGSEQNLHYIETDETVDTPSAKEPRAKGILSLIFGILSIILGGIVGIVLGVLARRFALPILTDFAGTLSAKLAKAGRITGTVGLALSIVGLVLCILVVAVIAVLLYMLLFDKAFKL